MASPAFSNEHYSSLGLRLEIELIAVDLNNDADRRTMVANYLAEYVAYQYTRREVAENLISTVMYELIEALSFLVVGQKPIKVTFADEKEELHIWIEHELENRFDSAYPAFLASIENGVPSSSYQSLLTTPPNFEPEFNQLGLAMIAHDFGSRLLFVPASTNPQSRTQIRIPTKDLQS